MRERVRSWGEPSRVVAGRRCAGHRRPLSQPRGDDGPMTDAARQREWPAHWCRPRMARLRHPLPHPQAHRLPRASTSARAAARPPGAGGARSGPLLGRGRHAQPRAPGQRQRSPRSPIPRAPASSAIRDRILHRHRVPSPRRQDPGLRLPRRPPAHPAHPRPRGRPGRHRRSRRAARAQRRAHRGHRPRPRLRPRPGRPRQRGRLRPVSSPAATTTPCGAPTSSWRRSTCAPRPSTASATTPGRAPPPPRPRARS